MAKSEVKPPSVGLITPAQASRFWGYVDQWQEKLGLARWRVVKSREPAKGAQAMISSTNRKQQQATVRVGLDWGTLPITEHELESTACHEMLHLLLDELILLAGQAGVSPDDVAAEEHRVINVLENLLVPKKG